MEKLRQTPDLQLKGQITLGGNQPVCANPDSGMNLSGTDLNPYNSSL
jgi:hypothetical protein